MKFFLVAVTCSMSTSPAVTGDRPNVLLFITDDESWLERSACGVSTVPTPAFDRVAETGVLFTNGFSSAPSCGPARAALLAGRNFWELGPAAFIQAWVPKETSLYTQTLASAGYELGRTGKAWGPGVYNEKSYGYDMAGTVYNGAPKLKDVPEYMSDLDYAANFEQFLTERPGDGPFCFWAGTTEPHWRFDAKNYIRLEEETGVAPEDLALTGPGEPHPRRMRGYANFAYEIVHADRMLGRMLDALAARGELENTLVIVTSDNGSGGQKAKASAYERGVHVPLAIAWPSRVPGGRTVTDFVTFADIGPTILRAADVEIPADISGRPFLDVLQSEEEGRVDASRDFAVTGLEFHDELPPESKSSRTIRDDRFAYILRYDNVDDVGPGPIEPSGAEFYDLVADPWQETDLVHDPAYASERDRLAARIEAFGLATGDPRFTGEMDTFRETREFVQWRRREGYANTR